MFKNMKVGTRLGLGFGVVLVLLAAIALLGISRMNMLNQSIDELALNRFPKTVWANNVINALNLNARSLRNALLLSDAEAQNKELERVAEAQVIITENLKRLEQTIDTEEGAKVLETVRSVRAEFIKERDYLMELIRAGRHDEAISQMLTNVRRTQATFFEALDALLKVQTQAVDRSVQAGDETYAQAFTIMVTLSALALLLGLGITFAVTRSITRPIAETVTVAQRLAKGDLSVRIEA